MMDQSSSVPNEYQSVDVSTQQTYSDPSQRTNNIGMYHENLELNVVNPLKRNMNGVNLSPSLVQSAASVSNDQNIGQISLVNFHQHFHTSSGNSNDGLSTQGHSYLPIVRNKIVNSSPISTTVPEFLYQLTKMLTDNNKEVIEWANGG